MTQLSDHELLESFHKSQDAPALNELARRYIGLVYSAARRQVRDAHLAEDITQAVFIVLVRNAGSMRRDCVLSAWLHAVTRHAVHNALRVQSRRRIHETRKVLMDNQNQTQTSDETNIADELRPHLDDAIARLPHGMRDSVILYFFGNRTHKQVGEQLGLSEDAARKRIGRALDRMRELLTGRGIGVAASSLAISAALSIESANAAIVAPAGLLASTVNIALLSNAVTTSAAGGGTIAASIAQGVGRIMTLTKIKVAAAVVGAALITGAVAAPLVSHAGSYFTVPIAQHTITTLVETNTAPATAPASSLTVEVSDKIKVELLGVSSYPPADDTWFAANGEPIDCPRPALLNSGRQTNVVPEPQYVMLIKVDKPDDTVVRVEITNSTTVSNAQTNDGGETLLLVAFNLNNAQQAFDFRVGLSDQPWKTVAASEKPAEQTSFDVPGIGSIEFQPVESNNDGCKVVAEMPMIRTPHQMIVVDDAGKEYKSENINISGDGQRATVTCTFSCPAEKVRQVQMQTREFNKYVQASDVSLEKGKATKPALKVTEAKEK